MSFDSFLDELALTKDEYILILWSSLKRPTLLLKRDPSYIWINPFAKGIPQLWLANIDAQFIVDLYVVSSYCSSYMEKFDRTLTSAFRKIREESITTKDDDDIQVIQNLGNTLLEHQQMSSRQAFHIVLSFPLHCNSRKIFFINTSPASR